MIGAPERSISQISDLKSFKDDVHSNFPGSVSHTALSDSIAMKSVNKSGVLIIGNRGVSSCSTVPIEYNGRPKEKINISEDLSIVCKKKLLEFVVRTCHHHERNQGTK